LDELTGLRGNGADGAVFLALTRAFVVDEEERAVLAGGAAHRNTEDIAIELQGLVGLAIDQFGGLDEIVVGACEGCCGGTRKRIQKYARSRAKIVLTPPGVDSAAYLKKGRL
jgi:hypothetical protein